jgi:hypothetical protein
MQGFQLKNYFEYQATNQKTTKIRDIENKHKRL